MPASTCALSIVDRHFCCRQLGLWLQQRFLITAASPLFPRRYGFLWRLIREATRSFPDPYLHLGGDEVEHECWKVRQ